MFLPVTIGFVLSLCLSTPTTGKELILPGLFSDHMVLQQKENVNFWGRSAAGQKVTIRASWGKYASAIVDAQGHWKAKILTPAAGGPYTILIKDADSSIMISDVLVGEVWLASGQSNMDIPLKGWPPGDTILDSRQEIGQARYPAIRFMKVPFKISVSPLDSTGGKWTSLSPETAGDFSATAYFYARRLHRELKAPVGIIQSSIGGTPAEAWTSRGSLSEMGDFDSAIDRLKDLQVSVDTWFKKLPVAPLPATDHDWQEARFSDLAAPDPGFDDSRWTPIQLPGRYDLLHAQELDGAVWLRKEFVIADTTADYILTIGAVDDMDATYINGKYVGGLVGKGYATTQRKITIPRSLLVKGRNIIAIRAIDTGGQGWVHGPMTLSSEKGDSISLEGTWRSRLAAELLNGKFYIYGLSADLSLRPEIYRLNSNTPTVLFNAMINPLIPYSIRGVIWYQGESNVGRAEQYKRLFPRMINDWRKNWGYAFPFYFVQLAPYLYSAPDQKGQAQKLRDAQRYALKLPKTGMVATLDIGYLKTAHPPYKQEVGRRLAGLALANDYGRKIVASGPLFKTAVTAGNKIIITFRSVGSGLMASSGGLYNFEIAGPDKTYVKATAKIINNKVVASAPSVADPVYARYAWSDSSRASLYNKEGLPAATFSSEQ